jgi:hypothetical protein
MTGFILGVVLQQGKRPSTREYSSHGLQYFSTLEKGLCVAVTLPAKNFQKN